MTTDKKPRLKLDYIISKGMEMMTKELWKDLAKWALLALISVGVYHVNADTGRIYETLKDNRATIEDHEKRISYLEGQNPSLIETMKSIRDDIKEINRSVNDINNRAPRKTSWTSIQSPEYDLGSFSVRCDSSIPEDVCDSIAKSIKATGLPLKVDPKMNGVLYVKSILESKNDQYKTVLLNLNIYNDDQIVYSNKKAGVVGVTDSGILVKKVVEDLVKDLSQDLPDRDLASRSETSSPLK